MWDRGILFSRFFTPARSGPPYPHLCTTRRQSTLPFRSSYHTSLRKRKSRLVSNGEAVAAFSCGRQPAVRERLQAVSREAAPAVCATSICCRRFAARLPVLALFRGLTPTARCCHCYAIVSIAIHSPWLWAGRADPVGLVWYNEPFSPTNSREICFRWTPASANSRGRGDKDCSDKKLLVWYNEPLGRGLFRERCFDLWMLFGSADCRLANCRTIRKMQARREQNDA